MRRPRTAGRKRVVAVNKRQPKRQYPEFGIQVTLASLLRQYYPDVLWFAVPNGGRRKVQDAKRFKDMGVRAGVFDIFVSEVTPIYPGFYVEIKAPNGSLSQAQKDFQAMAEARGYLCRSTTSALEGLWFVEEYLGIPRHERVVSTVT